MLYKKSDELNQSQKLNDDLLSEKINLSGSSAQSQAVGSSKTMQIPAIVVSTGGSGNPVNSFPLSVGRSEGGAAVAKSVSVGVKSTTVAASFSANTKTNPSTVHVAANVSN
ncbi:hypothetical protein HHI36_012865 [Cryptolaemus montrouzieri]|uniref:Uncharacterized protein n=1 Tax=Cryptolaemus montrouzieri TaxID=559131 RepID=A0ABD2NGI6_9CUCU